MIFKKLNFIKSKLLLPYPFDVENRYYKFVPIVVWLVSIFHILLEINFCKSIEFDKIFGFSSGYLYFLIFAIIFYLLLLIENEYTINSSLKIVRQNQWKVKNQICISFRIGVLCYLYIVLTMLLLDIKISNNQPSLLVLFFKTMSITVGLTTMAFLYDFNFFRKKTLIDELNKFKKGNGFNPTIERFTNSKELSDIIEFHPTFKTDSKAIIYCYSEGNYVIFYINKVVNPIKIKITFKEVEEKLKDYNYFIKCNRGLILNFNYFESINKKDNYRYITLKNIEKPLPISRNYYSNVDDFLKNRL